MSFVFRALRLINNNNNNNKAAANEIVKYGTLSASHIFSPLAVETAGTWNQSAIGLIQEIGRRITAVTEDTKTVFLF